MNQTAPRYFHYFAASLFADILFISIVYYALFGWSKLVFILLLWVIANFINYPRLATRRYISYYKILLLSFRQLITFYIFFFLILFIQNEHYLFLGIIESLAIFSIVLSRISYVSLLRYYRNRGKGYNRFIVVGDTRVMHALVDRFLSKKSFGYILDSIHDKLILNEIEIKIKANQINEIYCSSKCVNQVDISKLLSFSFLYGIDVHVVPDNQPEDSNMVALGAIALEYSELDVERYPLIDKKNLIIKRIFDILFSMLIILTVLSWLFPILGIIIKLDSRGPILFKQPRAGRNGKYFTCLKFRSMTINAGNDQAKPNDPRITKVGRIIRKLSIDEFPQFINVLLGQMSVVGPRPHVKDLNDKFDATINNYNDRILVKPGITGLSQITGHRGETAELQSMSNRIKVDLLYMKTWTLALDLLIIYKTVIDVLFAKGKNAY